LGVVKRKKREKKAKIKDEQKKEHLCYFISHQREARCVFVQLKMKNESKRKQTNKAQLTNKIDGRDNFSRDQII